RERGAGLPADLEAALGLALPEAPNTAAGVRPRALAPGPGEWVLIDAAPGEVEAALATCPGVLSHYADLSDARAGFLVTGEAAARLIASECPLDLAALPPDRCAQSVFAGMPILVDRRAGEDGFRLYVDVSLAAHLSAWLGAVAAEFG
ncbi:MAG TPA: sarcosine oxidase subunit gamma family protein, partial [Phenylobacterium sp.]|uniref:sarcosine oxidase subunit gamma family protein n=1 Tax=Phenylobacterium sp. TaxID=1871053 RepID=UPI002D4877C3